MPRGEKLKLQNFPTPEDCDGDEYEDGNNIDYDDQEDHEDNDDENDDDDDENLSASSDYERPPP